MRFLCEWQFCWIWLAKLRLSAGFLWCVSFAISIKIIAKIWLTSLIIYEFLQKNACPNWGFHNAFIGNGFYHQSFVELTGVWVSHNIIAEIRHTVYESDLLSICSSAMDFANVRTKTPFAPAFNKACVHSFNVEPVVMVSSIIKTVFPEILCFEEKTPRTFSLLCCWFKRAWRFNLNLRFKKVVLHSIPTFFAIFKARCAAWFLPLKYSFNHDIGTQVIISIWWIGNWVWRVCVIFWAINSPQSAFP